MASDYEKICEENRQRYGTDIGRIGPMLLADRYDDRTHFIFELLQNAEDALSRRSPWNGVRRVSFDLNALGLTVSHFGRQFDEADVRGVCGIAESTKDKFSIGRFGIGFKSVYTFTDRPEIHSGDEDFAIENYVRPRRVARIERAKDETLIILPFKPDDRTARQEITEGFKRLGPGALLFLHHIDELDWRVQGDASGVYLRGRPEPLGPNVKRVTVIGQESGQPDVDQKWLIFHREVGSTEGVTVGRVEIAFSLHPEKNRPSRWSIQPVVASPLVVFFPTVVSTNLGFLVQGPYRTTPSRDNIPRNEPWNQYLIHQTADLLVFAMKWLRDNEMLDASALGCFPLDREKFAEGSLLEPLFHAVREAFLQEKLLPRFDLGYVAAPQAKLARTQDLRELFSAEQVSALFAEASAWLSSEITQDRAPEVRHYLMRELSITEVTPATLIPRLNREFLEAQPNEWILDLYEFLSGQEAALRRHLDAIPIVRLDDGSHVVAREGGWPKAFLPSLIETDFPTVCREVCATANARNFLISLGITEPDPVDDVVRNLLPKYRPNELGQINVDSKQYSADIARIIAAFKTDSNMRRDKLLAALRETTFVMAIKTDTCDRRIARPGSVYISTDRLKHMFEGVPNVLMVDDEYECFRGENARELLEACGALRYLRPLEAPNALSPVELQELRRLAGHEETSGINDRVVDWSLQGFESLLQVLPTLTPAEATQRAKLLWESLGDLEERRGRGIFDGTYSWSHYGSYKKDFPSAFVRRLNDASWIPDESGCLQPPRRVLFESLGWKPNPFLLTKIAFRPAIIDQLAKEAGIDPALLELLKKHGITSEAELRSRLGITEAQPEGSEIDAPSSANVYDDAKELYGDDMPEPEQGKPDPDFDENMPGDSSRGGRQGGIGAKSLPGGANVDRGARVGPGAPGNGGGRGGEISHGGQGKRSPGHAGGRPFISYVGVHMDEDEADPDGLDHDMRMRIEEQAIELIMRTEPMLRRTPGGNPGFDLYEVDESGNPIRWVEVKSMTGSLDGRPVGLSHVQFDYARERGAAYWLYVVENATDPKGSQVLRIQDPVAHARTFTFDRGWRQIARTEPPN